MPLTLQIKTYHNTAVSEEFDVLNGFTWIIVS